MKKFCYMLGVLLAVALGLTVSLRRTTGAAGEAAAGVVAAWEEAAASVGGAVEVAAGSEEEAVCRIRTRRWSGRSRR